MFQGDLLKEQHRLQLLSLDAIGAVCLIWHCTANTLAKTNFNSLSWKISIALIRGPNVPFVTSLEVELTWKMNSNRFILISNCWYSYYAVSCDTRYKYTIPKYPSQLNSFVFSSHGSSYEWEEALREKSQLWCKRVVKKKFAHWWSVVCDLLRKNMRT